MLVTHDTSPAFDAATAARWKYRASILLKAICTGPSNQVLAPVAFGETSATVTAIQTDIQAYCSILLRGDDISRYQRRLCGDGVLCARARAFRGKCARDRARLNA